MATRPLTGYQREVAERNVEAILDAAEDLLRSQGQVNISAVAVQAGVSRVAEFLSPEAVTRTHRAAHQTIGALAQRGQADGSFRTDLPVGWLVTARIALIYACSDQVRAGQIRADDAVRILTTSVRDLFTGTQPGVPCRYPRH